MDNPSGLFLVTIIWSQPTKLLQLWPGGHRAATARHTGRVRTRLGKFLQVQVRDNNVEQALRVLKKRLQREGVFREMKLRKYFEKPSEERVRRKAEAVRRNRKAARKQAIREGLIAAPKRPEHSPGARTSGPR